MAILYACPQCGTSVRAPEAAAGKSANCPSCGVESAVPATGGAATTSRRPRPAPAGRIHPVKLGFYAAGGLVVVAIGLWFLGLAGDRGTERLFADKAKEWGRLEYAKVEGAPYRQGRVAVVRAPTIIDNKVKVEATLDENHFQLSGAIRADDPEDVETVVVCRYSGGQVGQYVDSSGRTVKAAVQVRATLTLYDLKQKVCLGDHEVVGDPDSTIDSWESGIGKLTGIADWIEALPAK